MNPVLPVWTVYGLWLALVVYLTVTAVGVKRDDKPHLGQSFALMFAMIAAFVAPHLAIFRFVEFAPVGAVPSGVGLIVCLAGMALLVWARQSLGKNWSQTVSAKQDHELITSGPYRLVRNPMYTGGILACIGSAIVAGGAFVFLLALLMPLFVWRVSAEDRLMARQFPDEYPDYRRRTKGLIPFVW